MHTRSSPIWEPETGVASGIQLLFSLLQTAPTKEQALRQLSTLLEQDEALAITLVSALLIHTLERQEIYPLLGLEPLAMVDLQILASFSAATWHGVAKSVVRDRLTQQNSRNKQVSWQRR